MPDLDSTANKDHRRLLSKLDRSGGPSACWPYVGGALTARGYGQFWLSGSPAPAHRAMWVLLHGPLPTEVFVCHECDNPPCCNPSHLFIGTDEDNKRDCWAKGRQAIGERVGTSKLTEKQVREIAALKGSETQAAIAIRFGVDPSLVGGIWRGHFWRHLGLFKARSKRKRIGEANHNAKLTATIIKEIRALAGTQSQRAIGSQFGVTHCTVGAILRGETWTHV